MQAIARVNRTFSDKPGGLVVDYLGIAEALRAALADYTKRDRDRQEVGAPVEEALALLEEKHEILCELLYGCPWREALDSGLRPSPDRGHHGGPRAPPRSRPRWTCPIGSCTTPAWPVKPSPLPCPPRRRLRFRDDLAFFQAVALELRRARASRRPMAPATMSSWRLQSARCVSDAVTASGVIDIYAAAGLERPDISIIDDDFARRVPPTRTRTCRSRCSSGC